MELGPGCSVVVILKELRGMVPYAVDFCFKNAATLFS